MKDSFRVGQGSLGIERLDACLHDHAFSPHRHETYAIGITLSGIKTFRYRGAQRHCLPQQCHVVHPDELHDGSSGGESQLNYRAMYIDPALVQQALGGKPLPFVPNPVLHAGDLERDLLSRMLDIDDEIDDVGRVEIAVAAADTLEKAATNRGKKQVSLALTGLLRVRDLIAASPTDKHNMQELERAADLDRWMLARQFRAAFGTSPTRFRTTQQLDRVRRLLRSGTSLADAAAEAGFADQGHMTRMFKRTYGLTPGKWAAVLAGDGDKKL